MYRWRRPSSTARARRARAGRGCRRCSRRGRVARATGSPSTVIRCRAARSLHGQRERAQAGERLAPAAVVLAPVHEPRVEAERDVVQEEAVVRPADVDPPLFAVRTPRARRSGPRGRGRGPGRSGCGSRTGCRRTECRCSIATPATGASEPSPPAIPSTSAFARRATSGKSSPSSRKCTSMPRALEPRRASSSALGEPVPERGLTMRNRCIE